MTAPSLTVREQLTELAGNIWWSWQPDVLALFEELNPAVFAASNNNPLQALAQPSPGILHGESFGERVNEAYARFRAYIDGPGRYQDAPAVAYFCMEYGLHESLPLYSGGLGVLAGDHTKAASDLGLRFTGIGLMLREGYFRQFFDASGRQQEAYPPIDLNFAPLKVVTGDDGEAITVSVTIGRTEVKLQAWELNVGRSTLYLLDTNVEGNPDSLRTLTSKLYQGGNEQRIQQEIILGIGGLRFLRAIGAETDVFHMNEGHCAFLGLELIRERMIAGDSKAEAEAWVRENSVFTTHTPVKAGHDRFSPALFNAAMTGFRDELGFGEQELLAYGRVDANEPGEFFTMTVLGLRLSRQANGVSELNGEVARRQWTELYPSKTVAPIGHITNGVHLPTWTAAPAKAFAETKFGAYGLDRMDAGYWAGVDNVPDEGLWELRTRMRRRLIDYINRILPTSSFPMEAKLDPEALTIGFARRFATYKRAPLFFADLERALQLFAQEERPIQLIYAGKAHPHDEGGKDFIQQILQLTEHPILSGKLIFLENYSMETGRFLTSGCDVWLNNPRRPMEASGTSGQKESMHGGLKVS
ncbi:MAG: alpha-glucan family phosphorylase, partial [Bacteroidota bacterium]